MTKLFLCVLSVLVVKSSALSQSSLYMPLDIKHAYDKGTRSYDGTPGPNYWQNGSEYNIKASIEPGTRLLSGTETITYYNNSPDTLKDLVIRLYQDINKPGAPRDFQLPPEALTDGVVMNYITVNGITIDLKDDKQAERYGTNLTIHPDPLIPPHSTAQITASWSFTIPKGDNIRMGTYDSTTFFVAYWYPQISVYDDIHGWDRTLYMGQLEFYNDFNDYDVEITVPPGYSIWSTGVLQNPKEVYSPEILSRYNLALQSDSVIHIITEDDLEIHPSKEGVTVPPLKGARGMTWRIHAASVPDFAFAVSNKWLWDAVSINPLLGGVPEGRGGSRTLISAVYDPASKDFYEVAVISRQTIDYYSHTYPGVPYPYPRMTVFNGGGGMEFPMMVNEGSSEERKWTVYVTTHEIAHTYFPFYMGINERKYAWMDEGWAQNLGEHAQEIVDPSLDQQARNVFRFLNYSGNENDVPMIITSDNVHNSPSYGNSSYFRPDNAYNFLKDALGEQLFLDALQEYMHRWHGKHPIPYDFFFTFNDVTNSPLINVSSRNGREGEQKGVVPSEREQKGVVTKNSPLIKGELEGVVSNLDWFFIPWFFEQGYPDLAIKNVNVIPAGSKRGTMIDVTIEKLGNLPVPIYVTAKTTDGDSLTTYESCEIWSDGRKETTVSLPTSTKKGEVLKFQTIILGNQYIPDADTTNNVWIAK